MIIAKRQNRTPYPPTGSYIKPPKYSKSFKSIQIRPFTPFRLKEKGVMQPQAEANILMKMAAIVQNRAMSGGDLLSR